eukprot:scaffold13700_cov136-Isochrysis_galbana.AAC.3
MVGGSVPLVESPVRDHRVEEHRIPPHGLDGQTAVAVLVVAVPRLVLVTFRIERPGEEGLATLLHVLQVPKHGRQPRTENTCTGVGEGVPATCHVVCGEAPHATARHPRVSPASRRRRTPPTYSWLHSRPSAASTVACGSRSG